MYSAREIKFQNLELLCKENKLDALCIVEHWLVEKEIVYYNQLSCLKLGASFCRVNPRGGTAIYVNSLHDFKQLDLSQFCEEFHAEFAGVEIKKYSLIIVSMYRSPI